jgi:hypothetical protein
MSEEFIVQMSLLMGSMSIIVYAIWKYCRGCPPK